MSQVQLTAWQEHLEITQKQVSIRALENQLSQEKWHLREMEYQRALTVARRDIQMQQQQFSAYAPGTQSERATLWKHRMLQSQHDLHRATQPPVPTITFTPLLNMRSSFLAMPPNVRQPSAPEVPHLSAARSFIMPQPSDSNNAMAGHQTQNHLP